MAAKIIVFQKRKYGILPRTIELSDYLVIRESNICVDRDSRGLVFRRREAKENNCKFGFVVRLKEDE